MGILNFYSRFLHWGHKDFAICQILLDNVAMAKWILPLCEMAKLMAKWQSNFAITAFLYRVGEAARAVSNFPVIRNPTTC